MKIIIVPLLLSGMLGIFIPKTSDPFILDRSKIEIEKNNIQESATAITIVKKWEMPKPLIEISGLSYLDDQHFACIQDELGKIFIYNIKSSSVEKEISFGAIGDYEELAVVGPRVLRPAAIRIRNRNDAACPAKTRTTTGARDLSAI